MVSLINYGIGGNTYVGLSTDSKPSNANNGDCFLAMDTSKIYFYDATGEQWHEWGA